MELVRLFDLSAVSYGPRAANDSKEKNSAPPSIKQERSFSLGETFMCGGRVCLYVDLQPFTLV